MSIIYVLLLAAWCREPRHVSVPSNPPECAVFMTYLAECETSIKAAFALVRAGILGAWQST
jgi:hypothetical protein